MLSSGPSQGVSTVSDLPPSSAPAEPVGGHDNLHIDESGVSEHELDDGRDSDASSASGPASMKTSTSTEDTGETEQTEVTEDARKPEEHTIERTSSESAPELPTISVSAAPAEEPQAKTDSPPSSAPPSTRTSTSSRPISSPPTTAPNSSWWKRNIGMAFTGDSAASHSPAASPTTTTPPAAEVPAVARLRNSLPAAPPKNSPLSSFTSMFTRRTTQQNPAVDDELSTMNLAAALPVPPADPTPEDYHALHAQTLALLSRFQDAYKTQTTTLDNVQSELSASREEHAQVSARARHLRSQLDETLARAAGHEAAMAAALEELSAEKRARLELEGAVPSAEGSVVTEDLAAEEDQRREGDETDGESIFSRSRSPTLAESESALSPPLRPRSTLSKPSSAAVSPAAVARRPQPAPQPQKLNAFQKMFRGMAGEDVVRCANCRGGEAGIAWDTVTCLKEENRGLKERVGVLEGCGGGAGCC